MKQTFNYCPVMNYPEQLEDFGGLQGFCAKHHLDGVELLIYDDKGYKDNYIDTAIGVHLQYWPIWLDFWRGEQQQVLFPIEREYGIQEKSREEWLQKVRANIAVSAKVQPKYMVWHVSHSSLTETYTLDYHYTDEQVVDATIEVFREVADAIPKGTYLLFENLWHSGLKLTNPSIVDRLLNRASAYYDKVGLMLDTGHLMNTNMNLQNEEQGVQYILNTVRALGSNAKAIKGMHLNCSLSGAYQKTLGHPPTQWDMNAHMVHITSIDQHKPFKQADLRPLIDAIQPLYVTHELNYASIAELDELLSQYVDRYGF